MSGYRVLRPSNSFLLFRRAFLFSYRCLMMAAVGMALSGCSDGQAAGPERSQVSGTVTMAGKPVPYGTISFIPPQGSGLPVAGAESRDGAYECSKNGGVPLGKYRVEINGWATPPVEQGTADLAAPTQPPLIPSKYNSQSTLTLAVDSTNPLVHDFELK